MPLVLGCALTMDVDDDGQLNVVGMFYVACENQASHYPPLETYHQHMRENPTCYSLQAISFHTKPSPSEQNNRKKTTFVIVCMQKCNG